jgi:hypothetical protein
MLEEAEKKGNDSIASFFPHGRAFAIHKPREFVAELMPNYFSTTRMSSFQRQLNLYGFRRITDGRDKGGYYHQHFLRGRKNQVKKIHRKKTSGYAPSKIVDKESQRSSNLDMLLPGSAPRSLNPMLLSQLTAPSLLQQQHSVSSFQRPGLNSNSIIPTTSNNQYLNPVDANSFLSGLNTQPQTLLDPSRLASEIASFERYRTNLSLQLQQQPAPTTLDSVSGMLRRGDPSDDSE